ncbi:unnamed protein product [Penicillium nalgiovense]|nr:unnamed protein product [Penicillium nalgiovense]
MDQQAIQCLWKILFSANPLYNQPIKETRIGLAGPDVYAKMSDVSPPQPTELIYCTALRVFPRQEREYPRRRSRTEDNRPQCTSARTAALVVSSSLVFANRTCKSWSNLPIYKLMMTVNH